MTPAGRWIWIHPENHLHTQLQPSMSPNRQIHRRWQGQYAAYLGCPLKVLLPFQYKCEKQLIASPTCCRKATFWLCCRFSSNTRQTCIKERTHVSARPSNIRSTCDVKTALHFVFTMHCKVLLQLQELLNK